MFQGLYAKMFSGPPFEAEICANGQEVLDAVAREKPDVIVLDVKMPVMDGFDACRHLRNSVDSCNIPIIMVSGLSAPETIIRGLESGATDYILKPFEVDELLAKATFYAERSGALNHAHMPKKDTRFANRYEVKGELAVGNSSTVYLAVQEDSDPPDLHVALKVYDLPADVGNTGQMSRYKHEIKWIEALSHPAVPKLVDHGFHESAYFLALEYIDGIPLAQHVQNSGVYRGAQLLKLARELADFLTYMHDLNAVHADIQPRSVLITREGGVRLTSFPTAVYLDSDESTNWPPGDLHASPHYCAPECIRDRAPVRASDVYSLGATLYFAATGHTPFSGSILEVLNKHLSDAPESVLAHAPHLNQKLAAIIDASVERDAHKRPKLTEIVASISELTPS
jgi:CheY-like chemotaxis protein